MRTLLVPSLIVFLGITLSFSKPLEETTDREELRDLNKTEIAEMIEDSKLLEKFANETYYAKVPTSEETYPAKDPTGEETYLSKDPTGEETYLSKDPTDEETDLTKDITEEETYRMKDPTADATGLNGNEELDDEDEDEATVDKPSDADPLNFLKYPKYEEDFKPYPRFAILRNGYVHHMNLEF